MTKFRALLALNLRAMLTSFRIGGRKKSRSFSGAGALLLIAGLSAYLSGVYSFLFAGQLAQVGALSLLLPMMALAAVVMGFFFSLFAAQGVVFGARDNDLMLSLPVSAFTLMLSRTLALYLENLVTVVFVLLPAGAAYLWHGGTGGAAAFLLLLVSGLFLALLPTLLSLVCGFALAWLSSKFTRKALISNVLYLVFLAALFAVMFRLNGLLTALGQAAGDVRQAFRGWGAPLLLLERAVSALDMLALLAFCALCLLPFLAVVWLFAGRYKRIVTGLTARGARSDYRLGRMTASGRRRALLKKEAARFFGTPIYLFNAGTGLLLLMGAGVVALFQRQKLAALLSQLSGQGAAFPTLPLLTAAVWFLLATVSITASSISLEGKQLWILKSAPVSVPTLFLVKIGFQLLVVLPCMLVGTALLCAAFGLGPVSWLVLVLAGAAFALFSAPFGLYVNLCFPKLDAINDTVVVKQSAAAMLGAFIPMLLALAGLLVWFLLGPLLGDLGSVLLCTALYAAGAAVMVRLLLRRGMEKFDAL